VISLLTNRKIEVDILRIGINDDKLKYMLKKDKVYVKIREKEAVKNLNMVK